LSIFDSELEGRRGMEHVIATFYGSIKASRNEKIGFEELELREEVGEMASLGRILNASNGASHPETLLEQLGHYVGCNVSRGSSH